MISDYRHSHVLYRSQIRCKAIAWQPEDATQLATGSESDQQPVIQVIDMPSTMV